MKILCIGRNYVDHIKELNNQIPGEPVIFSKPDSALLLKNKPFFIPEFAKDFHHEVEVVVKINRLGKNIAPEFAHRYYNEQHEIYRRNLKKKVCPGKKQKPLMDRLFYPSLFLKKSLMMCKTLTSIWSSMMK